MNHIILYSHGFGVDKTDRGLFTAIANAIPEVEHIMFEYDPKDKNGNTVVETFSGRKDKLIAKYNELRKQNPDAVIDLVCHSQGCLVAALAKLENIRKVILLTPPIYLENGDEKREKYLEKPTVKELSDGTLAVRRRDGSTTLIRQSYWGDFGVVIDSERLYNKLSRITELIAIRATEDEILQNNSYDGFEKSIKIIDIEGNHSFDGEARPRISKAVHQLIMEEM